MAHSVAVEFEGQRAFLAADTSGNFRGPNFVRRNLATERTVPQDPRVERNIFYECQSSLHPQLWIAIFVPSPKMEARAPSLGDLAPIRAALIHNLNKGRVENMQREVWPNEQLAD